MNLIETINYFVSLDLYFHASLVQFPEALNIKLLPLKTKKHITDKWNNLDIDNLKTNAANKKRIKYFGQQIINYMNSEDLSFKLNKSKEYINTLDHFFKSNIEDVNEDYKYIFK